MAYSTNTLIRGLSLGDPDRIVECAIARGALRPTAVRSYIRAAYSLAAVLGLNPDVVVAQSIHETSENGVPWTSSWWEARLNPAGIGTLPRTRGAAHSATGRRRRKPS
jgi:hypothetical protein